MCSKNQTGVLGSMSLLKLAALDDEDLRVISAHVQDALATVGDIELDARSGRVIVALKRYVWQEQTEAGAKATPQRRVSMLAFDRVTAMQAKGIDPKKKDAVLSLLSLSFEQTDAPGGHIDLTFSGHAAIRLTVECVEARLTDMAATWSVASEPHHPADDEA
jgi:hypothetical protein